MKKILKTILIVIVVLYLIGSVITEFQYSERDIEKARTSGYEAGWEDGYDDGYEEGYEYGHWTGFDEGYDVGYEEGYNHR